MSAPEITLQELEKSARGISLAKNSGRKSRVSNCAVYVHLGEIEDGEVVSSEPILIGYEDPTNDILFSIHRDTKRNTGLVCVCLYPLNPYNESAVINLESIFQEYAKKCSLYEAGITKKIPYLGLTVHPKKYDGVYAIGMSTPVFWTAKPSKRKAWLDNEDEPMMLFRGLSKKAQIAFPTDQFDIYFPEEQVRIIDQNVISIEQAFLYTERQMQEELEREAAVELAQTEEDDYKAQRERDIMDLRSNYLSENQNPSGEGFSFVETEEEEEEKEEENNGPDRFTF